MANPPGFLDDYAHVVAVQEIFNVLPANKFTALYCEPCGRVDTPHYKSYQLGGCFGAQYVTRILLARGEGRGNEHWDDETGERRWFIKHANCIGDGWTKVIRPALETAKSQRRAIEYIVVVNVGTKEQPSYLRFKFMVQVAALSPYANEPSDYLLLERDQWPSEAPKKKRKRAAPPREDGEA